VGQVLVSVVMPVYNTAYFLPEAIESIVNQTYRNIELVIVDDASEDDSWHVIDTYAQKDDRIVAVRNQVNVGVLHARNIGVERASGIYVAQMDSDDIALPERISRQVDFLEENPEYGACGSNIYEIDAAGEVGRVVTYPASDEEIKRALFFVTPVRQSTLMVRRECFERLGRYEDMPEELDLLMRIGSRYKLANLQECLVKYRIRSGSFVATNLKTIIQWTLQTRQKAVRVYGYKMPALGYVSYFVAWLMLFLPSRAVFCL
jgi:glycosyltransferase involved in cell wall biosynthesis